MTDEPHDPATVHAARAERFHARADAVAKHALRLSTARLVTFILAAAAFVAAYNVAAAARPALIGAGAVLLLGFLALVVRHRRATGERRWQTELARGSELALARLRRDWNALPAPDPRDAPAEHPYAADLDVFGRASLAQLLGAVSTAPGRGLLHGWLLKAAPVPEVLERQAAVAELAPLLDLREELAARGRLAGTPDPAAVAEFVGWATGDPWLARRPALRALGWLLPAAIIILAALQAAGILAGAWWALGLLGTGAVTARTVGPIHAIYRRASAGQARIAGYAAMLERLHATDFRSPLLKRLHDQTGAPGNRGGAARALRRLQRILDSSETRESNLAYMIVQFLLLWDVHVLSALERWQATWGAYVPGWLDALGQADALAALAGLAHDHPDWHFPELASPAPAQPPILRATALAHPLLPPENAVRNDVQVGPPGTFLLVTGSNMSGKSTLLRAIGLNAVLAQAGGPVCAERLSVPPLELWTSMRVTDSLERGVSTFMAELQRLKAIVDAARELESEPGRTLLYLVDEVLQGTNSAERQVAARHILRHLVDHGAIGAVTTHDLELGNAPELADVVVAVHFRETVHSIPGGPPLTFDYRLRPGVATSRNALKLMEIVGLGGG